MKFFYEGMPILNDGRIADMRQHFKHRMFNNCVRQTSTVASKKKDISAVTVLFIATGLLLSLAVAWIGRTILLLLFASIVVAILLTSIVDWAMAKMKLGRTLAFVFILLATSVLVFLGVWISGPNIIEQFESLQVVLPQAVQQSIGQLNGYGWGRWALAHWTTYSQLSSSISYALTSVGGMVLSAASLLVGLFIIGFLSLYLAAEPKVYFSGLRRMTPLRYRTTLDTCATCVVHILRAWIFAQMMSMVAIGVLVTLGLWLLGVPLAGSLGIIAALLTFIPNVGPILSVFPAALLAFAISPSKGLLTILLFALVHFLEGNVITPLIQRKMVQLPPALTLTVQLFLAVIAGPLGIALAAPLTAAMIGVFRGLFPIDPVSSKLTDCDMSPTS
jgi:predicted PurR-regulated permease PerM